MNLLHLKYAIEVANTGSVNRAAETLFVGQPNISRAIKELESSLDITIFERSSKGMVPTADGEMFLLYAKAILAKVDALEDLFKKDGEQKLQFSISVPRATYIADAFAHFSNSLNDAPGAEVFYQETTSMQAIKNITQGNYKLAIIRYPETQHAYYRSMLEEKGLAYELVAEFRYWLIVHKSSRLAELDSITEADLQNHIEIVHANQMTSALPYIDFRQSEWSGDMARKIYVFERAVQFDLLAENPQAFMWVSPIPEQTLKRYDLVQRSYAGHKTVYRDMLIRQKDYRLSTLDKRFISELCEARRRIFPREYD